VEVSWSVTEVDKIWHDVRFEVSMTMKIQIEVFWVVMPCSVVVGYKYFKGPCWFHLQGEVTGSGKETA
jgi:hypothetical protein